MENPNEVLGVKMSIEFHYHVSKGSKTINYFNYMSSELGCPFINMNFSQVGIPKPRNCE